jgi:protein-serine/threonine kinase
MTGEDTPHGAEARGRQRLSPSLQIPKNRSTGNLGTVGTGGDNSEKARIRFSFDAGASAVEYDTMSRSAFPRKARGVAVDCRTG